MARHLHMYKGSQAAAISPDTLVPNLVGRQLQAVDRQATAA
jgi:hypothetical protein